MIERLNSQEEQATRLLTLIVDDIQPFSGRYVQASDSSDEIIKAALY